MGSPLDQWRVLQASERPVLWASDLARKQEELEAEFLQSQRLPIRLQTGALEGGDEIVGEPDDFQVESISREGAGGDFTQGVILAQLGDAMGQTPTVGGGDVEPAHNGVGLVIGLRPTEVFSELAHALSVVGADSHKNSMALVEQGESDTHRPGRRP